LREKLGNFAVKIHQDYYKCKKLFFFVEVTREFIDVYYFPEHRQAERQNPNVATVYM